MTTRVRLRITLALVGLAAGHAVAGPSPGPAMTVDRVVIVMRHGVRPPTKDPAMPASVTPERWPAWPVAPGWLTPHGAQAVTALASSDRRYLMTAALLPARGCPASGTVAIIADSDERTIATAQAWARGLAPGCAIAIDHHPQGEQEPRFNPYHAGVTLDAADANASVAAAIGPGGLAALDRQYRPLLARLDAILCPGTQAGCGVGGTPTGYVEARADARPKLRGALDQGSTAAQILLLEYADGKPPAEIGWGRATPADITTLSALHALEFRLLARPLPLARANLALLTPIIARGLTTGDARVTVISGHDTQVASLGGLLGLHWRVPGFAEDDPAPGGAIIIERGHDAKGTRRLRARYRAQPLDALRAGSGTAIVSPWVDIPCPESRSVELCLAGAGG